MDPFQNVVADKVDWLNILFNHFPDIYVLTNSLRSHCMNMNIEYFNFSLEANICIHTVHKIIFIYENDK